MFKQISDYEIDSKGRFVKHLPLGRIKEGKEDGIRKLITETLEKELNGMPTTTISLSNNPSDSRSLIRVSKYEFIITNLSRDRKVLMVRTTSAQDSMDASAIEEYNRVIKIAKKSIEGLLSLRID